MLTAECDSGGTGEVKTAAEVRNSERAAILASEKASVSGESPELDATQVRPDRALHFISALL